MSWIFIKFGIFLSIAGIVCSQHLDMQDNIITTGTEEKIFQHFKTNMILLLKQNFMKTDQYLLTTLRKNSFNATAAEVMIKENLLWREKNQIDTILTENFEDMENMFPFQIDSTSLFPIGKLDIKNQRLLDAINSVDAVDRFIRYLIMLLEKMTHEVIDKRMQGHNTTQSTIVANYQILLQQKEGCVTCQFAWMYLIHMAETYYTGLIKELIIFDAPANAGKLADALDCLFSSPIDLEVTIFGGKKVHRIGSSIKRNQFGCKQTADVN